MALSRRAFLASLPAAALGAQQPAKRPNVLVILTDDQGWGDLSWHGNSNLATPRIDSLAREGAQFDRFYVCPVCSPTRAEFLTGRYHLRTGVRGVSTGQERLNLDEHTIAQSFRAAGYATGAFGKWHNGSQAPYHPNSRGFDEYYGFTSGHWAHYLDTEMDHNGQLVKGKGYITDDLTNRAIAFISPKRTQPFFCYLPLNTPHSPMQVPDSFYAKFARFEPKLKATDPAQEDVAMTRAALAMVENIDWNIGRLLDRLRELRLEQDTIVVFFCDNGPNSWRWNGGMKGRKGSVDEGGIRSPLFIRWPGRVWAGRLISEIAAAIDLFPTLAALAGIPVGSTKPLDGRNFAPRLTGRATVWEDRMIFSHWNKRISVRTQRFRLDAEGRLFDMTNDPGQTRDVAAEFPAEAERLRAAAAAWGRELLPLAGPDDRPFPVGHTRLTYLPARDGNATGAVRRSNTAPNSSYFTNWTQTTDRIYWDVEVAQAGAYEAVLHYTAPAAGSLVVLSCGPARLESIVPAAHNPPPFGANEDRHDRGPESYAKDFRPWNLGVIQLPAGRNQLALRALRVTGESVAEVRYLILTRRGN
jgi:arylsulfatase A-like enzyme